MDELDAVGVGHAEHRRRGEEAIRPVLVRNKEAKEPGALGQLGEERQTIAPQPAIEGTLTDAFEGEQEGEGDEFARIERRLGMLGDRRHLFVHADEETNDKLLGRHGTLLGAAASTPSASKRPLSLSITSTNG